MLRFTKSTILRAVLLLGFMGSSLAPPARSQHIGDVSLTTTTQLLASATSCTGSPQNFNVANLGQSFHLATAAIVSGGGSFGMEIDGIDAVANVFKISNPMITVGTSAFLVQGTGFMPIIRVSLTCTAGSTFSLSYSGSFAANPITNVGAGGSGNTASTTIGGNVQGIIPTAQNGTPIFPVIGGSVQPAVNGNLLQFGVDTFGVSFSPQIPLAQNGTATLVPPTPTNAGEFGIVFLVNSNVGTVNTLLAPWSCVIGSCISSTEPEIATLPLGTSNNLSISVTNSNGGVTPFATFLLFNKTQTIRQSQRGNQTVQQVLGSNTLAGSTLALAVSCSSVSCSLAPADTQGLTWRLVKLNQPVAESGGAVQVLTTWMAGPTSAAADTVTFNAAAGTTIDGSAILELTLPTPAAINQPSAPLTSSNPKFQSSEDDPGGLFVNTSGFDYTQTLTLAAAGTFTFPLWAETQHGLLQSCTVTLRITAASGTTPTLNTFLQDSPDNIGFNDRLSMPQGTVTGAFIGSIPVFTASSLAATASSAVTSTDGALAAGSGIAGNLAAFGRIKFVVGGTTPSFTFNYNVACR